MKHLSPRLVVAVAALAILCGSSVAASAAGSNHVVCVINQDPGPDSDQHGLCLVVHDPSLPGLSAP